MRIANQAMFTTLVISVILTTLVFMDYYQPVAHPQQFSERFKTILYWTPMYKNLDMTFGLGSEIFQGCAYNNCFTTYRRNFLPIEEFDAVLIHAREYFRKDSIKFPDKRNPKQIYVFLIVESPSHTPKFVGDFNNIYNWTMTYRWDSDIVHPYGWVFQVNQTYTMPSIESIQRRPKQIAWMVSHCKTFSYRETLVKKLSQLIAVDVYGNCTALKCAHDRMMECYGMIENNYKFYLAFENSMCDDYVTEKLYNILNLNVIPIVYGGANYTQLAPPNSYIDANEFESVSALVEYIQFLDSTPEEYLKYFEWKRHYRVEVGAKRALCELCRKLHEDGSAVKTYTDIGDWWFGHNRNRCSVVDPHKWN